MFTIPLHLQLQGTTCYISRIRNHNHDLGLQCFATFHSIVYKILRITPMGNNLNNLHSKLVGGEMKELVKFTLTKLLHQPPTEEQINFYYNHLRHHLNGGVNISTIPLGQEFLKKYIEIKNEGLDWEESMQLATWYLENNHVDQILGFNFQNLILLNSSILYHPSNKNALLFFKAFCDWNSESGFYNIYIPTFTGLKKVQKTEITPFSIVANPFNESLRQ